MKNLFKESGLIYKSFYHIVFLELCTLFVMLPKPLDAKKEYFHCTPTLTIHLRMDNQKTCFKEMGSRSDLPIKIFFLREYKSQFQKNLPKNPFINSLVIFYWHC